MEILKSLCIDDQLHFELVRELLAVEQGYRTMARRANLFDRLEQAFRRGFYENYEDAVDRAAQRKNYDVLLENLRQEELDFAKAATDLVDRLNDDNTMSERVEKRIHDS